MSATAASPAARAAAFCARHDHGMCGRTLPPPALSLGLPRSTARAWTATSHRRWPRRPFLRRGRCLHSSAAAALASRLDRDLPLAAPFRPPALLALASSSARRRAGATPASAFPGALLGARSFSLAATVDDILVGVLDGSHRGGGGGSKKKKKKRDGRRSRERDGRKVARTSPDPPSPRTHGPTGRPVFAAEMFDSLHLKPEELPPLLRSGPTLVEWSSSLNLAHNAQPKMAFRHEFCHEIEGDRFYATLATTLDRECFPGTSSALEAGTEDATVV
ncbi:hypothetical protein ACHAWF_010612 [Thalassiosira exigua]